MIAVYIWEILKISLLNLLLSFDNMGAIALAVRDLPKNTIKKVTLVSMLLAMVLKILFSSILSNILMTDWLPIRLIGGFILCMITWNLIKPQQKLSQSSISPTAHPFRSILLILGADMSMSIENVLAIAVTVRGRIDLIVLGILCSMPVLFWGSQILSSLMDKYNIVIYLAGATLAYTGVVMILEDTLVIPYIPDIASILLPIAAAILVVSYGFWSIKKTRNKNLNPEIQ